MLNHFYSLILYFAAENLNDSAIWPLDQGREIGGIDPK